MSDAHPIILHNGGKPYATLPQVEGGVRPLKKRRMNTVSICLNIFCPWVLFCALYGLLSFSLHYRYPTATWLLVAFAALMVIYVGSYAFWAWRKQKTQPEKQEPTWVIFLFLTMTLAWAFGVFLGDLNYYSNLDFYYEITTLNSYPKVNPSQDQGEQFMDAGRVFFSGQSQIDLTRAIGYKDVNMYCVAPVTDNPRVLLSSYDFWVVGVNCCTGAPGDFKCGQYKNGKARAGVRLMNDQKLKFYYQALRQAESMFTIKSDFPLFFEWVEDPNAEINQAMYRGFNFFLLGIFTYFAFNLACVALAVWYVWIKRGLS